MPPLVIPIFHTGMANVIPLNPFTRKMIHPIPRTGKTVTARAGAAIHFDDLLEAHVKAHGPLRKLESIEEGTGGEAGDDREGSNRGGVVIPQGIAGDKVWKSTAEERQLYSSITRRIEEALLELEVEARRDLADDFPGFPEECAAMLRLGRGEEGNGGENGGGGK